MREQSIGLSFNEIRTEPDERYRVLELITKRYGKIDLDALVSVLCPLLIPIESFDGNVFKDTGNNETRWRATFSVQVTDETRQILQPGRTGKFVPRGYALGTDPWREIAKGRILEIVSNSAKGEVYIGGSSRSELERATRQLAGGDFLEVDQFGAAAKVLSALSEYTFARNATREGFGVIRMPEDMARHVGSYPNFDFLLERDGKSAKVEIKSIWGTDTRYARLIHSKTASHPTSSCNFSTQDIFAVSLFLRTGNIHDFAYALSISEAQDPVHGLPAAPKFPGHVNQNPLCVVDDVKWFSSLEAIWRLLHP